MDTPYTVCFNATWFGWRNDGNYFLALTIREREKLESSRIQIMTESSCFERLARPP